MRRGRFDQINIVPFVDIVLVLLVIVLATATFVQERAYRIDLPKGDGTPVTSTRPIAITIDANGTYAFEGVALGWRALHRKIKTMEANISLLLRTDRRAPFGAFLQLIQAIKAQKITSISVATEPVR